MFRFSLKSFLLWVMLLSFALGCVYRFVIAPELEGVAKAVELSNLSDRFARLPPQCGPWDCSISPDNSMTRTESPNVIMFRRYVHHDTQQHVDVEIVGGPFKSVSQTAGPIDEGNYRDLGTVEISAGEAQQTARFGRWMTPKDSPPTLYLAGMSNDGSWWLESEARDEIGFVRHCYHVQASISLPSENPTAADIDSAKRDLDDFMRQFVPAANEALFGEWQ